MRGRLTRLAQIALFAGVAAIVFAPLGRFYVQNPEFFATRMGQVSVFSDEVGGGNPWGALWYATRVSFGMFVARGDMNWRFNVAGAPVFWPPLGVFFILGIAIGLWRLVSPGRTKTFAVHAKNRAWGCPSHGHKLRGSGIPMPPGGRSKGIAKSLFPELHKATYWLLLLWLPVMLLPSILGGGDVELSLSLRAIGVMPALFYWPALGLVESALAARRLLAPAPFAAHRAHRRRPARLALLLVATGVHTYVQVFHVWGPSAPNYYVASGDLVEAADTAQRAPAARRRPVRLGRALSPPDDGPAGGPLRRHPLAGRAGRSGFSHHQRAGDLVRVHPRGHAAEGNPGPRLWAAIPGAAGARRPDGLPGLSLCGRRDTRPTPEHPGTDASSAANLGNTLAFLGYDLNAPARLGRHAGRDPLLAGAGPSIATAIQDGATTGPFSRTWSTSRAFAGAGRPFSTIPSSQWRAGRGDGLSQATFPTGPARRRDRTRWTWASFRPRSTPACRRSTQAGQMAGTTVSAGPLDVARAPAPPESAARPSSSRWRPALERRWPFWGSDRDRSDLRPGETLALSLYWLAEGEIEDAHAVALWLEGEGGRVPLWEGDPAQGRYPFARVAAARVCPRPLCPAPPARRAGGGLRSAPGAA